MKQMYNCAKAHVLGNLKFLFVLLLFVGGKSWGQVPIFIENVGSPTGNTTISAYSGGTAPATFQNKGLLTFSDGGQTNPADIRNSSGSSGYVGASGTGNVFFTTTNGAYGFSIEGIDASSFTTLTLQYGYRKESATQHAAFSVDYWDGTSWVTIANTAATLFNEAVGVTAGWYSAKTLNLPVGAQINGLKIRFVKTSGTLSIRIDDILLQGVSPNPYFTISGSPTNHGTVCPGSSTSPVTYTVRNLGNTTATGVMPVSNNSEFVVSNISSTTVAANGGTATYDVTFTPSSGGSKLANITVGPVSGSNTVTSSLQGTGTTPVTQALATVAASSILVTTATLNGNVTALGACPSTSEKGFVYSLTTANNDPFVSGTAVTKTPVAGLATGVYSLGLTGLTAGANYTFKAYVLNTSGTYTYGAAMNFSVGVPPTNDDCGGAVALTVGAAAITGSDANATQTIAAVCGSSTAEDDVWYSFTTSTAGNYTITVVGSASFDAVVELRTGACNGSYITCTDLTTGGGTETINATGLSASTTYYVRVYDYYNVAPSTTTFTIQVIQTPSVIYTWTGNNTPWLTTTDWSPTGYPQTSNHIAYFNTNSTVTAGINMNTLGGALTLGSLDFGTSSTSARTINNSSGSVGVLTLNGLTLGGVANTIIRNQSIGTHTITNGSSTMTLAFSNPSENVIEIDNSGSIVLTSVITGASSVTKAGIGAGVLFLNGSNTYTGATIINAGILNPATLSNGGSNSGIGASSSVASNLVLGGGRLQYTGATTSTNRNFTLTNSTVSTIELTNNLTISGAAASTSGALTKIGAGSLILTGGNSYTGTTTVTAGTLQLIKSGGTTIPVTNDVAVNGGILQISSNQTLNNITLSTGNITVDPGVTLTINGVMTISGAGTISNGGTIAYGSAGSLVYSNGTGRTTGAEWPVANPPVNVTLNNTSTVITLNGNKTIPGALTINNPAILVGSTFTISIAGSWTNWGSGGFTENTSTVDFTGTGAQSIATTSGEDFFKMAKSNSGTLTLGSDVRIGGTSSELNISSGIVDAGTYNMSGTSGAFLIMSGGTLKLGLNGATVLPDFTNTATNAYQLSGTSIIELSGTAGQILRGARNYINLTFSGGGTKTLSSGIVDPTNTITGTVTIANSTTLDVGGNSFGGGATNLSIPGTGKFITARSGFQPDISGTYSLGTGSTIEFNGAVNNILRQLNYYNLTLSGTSGIKTAPASTLTVSGDFAKAGANIFDANGGTILFSGTTPQTITTVTPQPVFNNMTVAAGSTVNVNDSIAVGDKLQLTGTAALILNAGNVTMKSTATKTASLGTLTSGTISYSAAGRFLVERYITTTRKWQFLSTGATGAGAEAQTFQSAWMEGQTPGSHTTPASTGYGMWITDPSGTANGFDSASVSPNIKWFNGTDYTGITSPGADMHNPSINNAYMTFVRGDRYATGSNSFAGGTVLRTKGKLNIYDYPTSGAGIPVDALGGITTMGNPYASPVDLSQLTAVTLGNAVNIMLWDPKINGAQGFGGFQYLTRLPGATNYTVSPGSTSGGSYGTLNVNDVLNTIESGQAFFVQSSGTALNFKFTEPAKTASAHGVFFTPGNQQFFNARLFLKDAAGNPDLADGFRVIFDNSYNSTADFDDAHKLPNTNENISVKTQNTLLAVELRKPVDEYDTIHINLANMRVKDYSWTFSMTNMDAPGRLAFLVDQYLGTTTLLDLNAENTYDFSVTSTAASFAANRFLIVFKPGGVVPVSFTSITAKREKDLSATVKWNTATEINIHHYEVKRSYDGLNFTTIASVSPVNNAGAAVSYTYIDARPATTAVYYHIVAVSNNGQVQRSRTVKLDPLGGATEIVVSPNPVKDKTIHLQMNNQPAGDYTMQLINNAGQVVYKTVIPVNGNAATLSIKLGSSVAAGSYNISLQRAGEKAQVQQVVIL